MEKKRAVELLIQEVDKIPYLKTLPSSNDEFRLWLKNVENIINKGLEPEDKNKYQEASQFLTYLRGVHEEDLIQQDYIDEIVRYEIALKSILQKYEILGIEGDENRGGEVEKQGGEEIMNLYKELLEFYEGLKQYKALLNKLYYKAFVPQSSLNFNSPYDKDENKRAQIIKEIEEKREHLVRKSGRLILSITESTGENTIVIYEFGKQRSVNIWVMGLREEFDYRTAETLNACIDYTSKAISKLEADIEMGIRDKKGNLIKEPQRKKVSGLFQTYENYEGRIFGDEFEVTLKGNVDMTIESMTHFTKKLNSQGHLYKSSPRIGGHPDYAKPDRTCFATCTITETTEGTEKQIGTIKLQLLPNERTLLKTSHPKDWDSSFKYFLEVLFMEFERLGHLKAEKPVAIGESPKAFIAHGGRSGVLDKLREFIQALGIDPLIVELLPAKGMSVDDKVNKYIKDADCGIVLATGGGIVDKKSEKEHPRLNVIDEFERLRTVFPNKTILLLEKGVDLPSNISGLTYEPFVRQSMDRAFTAIARELTAFGILRAVKPKTEY